MISRRKIPDGLPFRLYMDKGARTVAFFYKLPRGKREFTLSAPVNDNEAVARIRRIAIEKAEAINGTPKGMGETESLIGQYFDWQEAMPASDEMRKADDTLKENKREAENLKRVFGKMKPSSITPVHIYRYLDERTVMKGPRKGQKARAKANKEIALLSAILEYGRRKGAIGTNPCKDISYNPTTPRQNYTAQSTIDYAMKVARERGGASYLVAMLCIKTAYLTASRPGEMRKLRRSSITPEGILIQVGKRKKGHAQKHKLIEWSPELKSVIDEAISLQSPATSRWLGDTEATRTPSMLVFGNRNGQEYSRSGWTTTLNRLMGYCEEKAEKEGVDFKRFTLLDMRPASVTDRKDAGDKNITDATGHTSDRMVNLVYDRRKVKRAKATK